MEDTKQLTRQIFKCLTELQRQSISSDTKRVIAKLKSQFEEQLNTFKEQAKVIEDKERQVLVAMSNSGEGTGLLSPSADSLFWGFCQ